MTAQRGREDVALPDLVFLFGSRDIPPTGCVEPPSPSAAISAARPPKRLCILAAAAKSRLSCPTLCDPIDGSPPGSTILGILQARTLEWVAISFSSILATWREISLSTQNAKEQGAPGRQGELGGGPDDPPDFPPRWLQPPGLQTPPSATLTSPPKLFFNCAYSGPILQPRWVTQCSDTPTLPVFTPVSRHSSGVTLAPLYTLGVTYLDENVKSSYSPVYIATFYTAAILGPAAGYLVGGALLNIYTDISQQTELTTESPLWVGAWWVGFLGAGAAAFLIAIPILGYPRQLPGSQRYVVMRASETYQLKDSSHEVTSNPDFGKTIRDLPLSIWLLLKNPTFILLCLAGATEATLIAGMSTFGPKFLESQFSLSASEAATLFGYLVVPAGGGGTFLGGFFVNKFKLRGSSIIKFCLLCTLISLLASFIFLMHCPGVPMAGVTTGYNGSLLPEGHLELMAACNLHCGCRPEHYSPVCGSDGLMYYSPCYAGCLEVAMPGPGGQKVYRDCSCVPQNFSSGFGHATAGKCTSTCQRKPLLLVFIFVVIVFTFLSSIPALTATLRCVCDQQRSFALGIQWIVVRTLGSIPGPIAFGWVIDKACLLWQDQCGQQGSCFVYQNSAMSWYLLIAGLGYKVLGSIFFAIAYFLYKSPLGSSDGLEASLPSQSSASDNPSDLQEAPSALRIQSNI